MMWWTSDILSSPRCALMDAPEIGAYVLLLTHQWQSEGKGLPTDEKALRRLARVRGRCDFAAVLEHFEERDGRLFNAKLHRQWEEAIRFHGKKAEAGRMGGTASSLLQAEAKQCYSDAFSKNQPSPRGEVEERGSDTDSEGEGSMPARGSAEDVPIPPALDTEAFRATWARWLRWRAAEKRKRVTVTAAKLTLGKLVPVGPVEAIKALEHGIANDYQGVNPDWLPGSRGARAVAPKPRHGGSNVTPNTMAAYERMGGGGGR